MEKSFSEMTKAERESLSDEEWKAVPPYEKKSCHDCKWCVGYVSLWCTNDEAAKVRGTKIPGCYNCDFWKREGIKLETARESDKRDEFDRQMTWIVLMSGVLIVVTCVFFRFLRYAFQ